MTRIFVFLSATFLFLNGAFAHGGHVGELAGHAHWVGVAATVGAAALAALIAKAAKGTEKPPEDEEVCDGEAEEQAEGATV